MTKRRSTGSTIVIAVIVIVSILVIAVVRLPSQGRRLSPESAAPDGTHALAQILRDHGVKVSEVTPLEALTLATPETTLLIDPEAMVGDTLAKDLIATRANIIVTADMLLKMWGFEGDVNYLQPTLLTPKCDDPDALAAGTIGPISSVFVPDDPRSVTGCFPADGGFAWVQSADNPHVTLVADTSILTNAKLAQAGNTAFLMRKLGAHPHVYWVSGSGDEDAPRRSRMSAGLPDWFYPVAGALALSLGWWALYRSRRFGKLVAEPLPVVVPAAETTRGRSILYQRGKNHQHAAQALRAGTIARVGSGRGIRAEANPDVVISTLAQASGYPPDVVADLFYERRVNNDRELTDLATDLRRFERDLNVQ
ncbi:DUF4350 domain-containing protein [Trueperella bialowiezensis]|uniref:DUF4350 domain-containing protein n=1 Tax=Trueperella bialowiezensis TaxID=312285 RepID=A0A3S4Z4Q5_9ACTO|nr:DUF4350 domain-containing protein [Trueperella bialowiezensis]VEI12894.1 Uncharacterised protein [Trueperella bialowiezensis]